MFKSKEDKREGFSAAAGTPRLWQEFLEQVLTQIVIVYVENPKKFTTNHEEQISDFSKIGRYKFNIKYQLHFYAPTMNMQNHNRKHDTISKLQRKQST